MIKKQLKSILSLNKKLISQLSDQRITNIIGGGPYSQEVDTNCGCDQPAPSFDGASCDTE